ncbi:hypothetical protein ES708_30390 [subsurface metagenome]
MAVEVFEPGPQHLAELDLALGNLFLVSDDMQAAVEAAVKDANLPALAGGDAELVAGRFEPVDPWLQKRAHW